MANTNTQKEGKGQAVHKELELHQSQGAHLTHAGLRALDQLPSERGTFRDWLCAGWQCTPAGSHATAVSPAAETENVLLFLPNSSCFSHRGRWCFRDAERNGSSGGVPHRTGWPKEPPRGHRSQANTLHLCRVPRTDEFTSLSPGAPAGCVVHRQLKLRC